MLDNYTNIFNTKQALVIVKLGRCRQYQYRKHIGSKQKEIPQKIP